MAVEKLNSRLVDWLPWSVLNTSGLPRPNASVRAWTLKQSSKVLDNRQDIRYRLCQSMIATG